MKIRKEYNFIEKDLGVNNKRELEIIRMIHNLAMNGATKKRVYNEITTKDFTRGELRLAFIVLGVYVALGNLGIKIN